MPSKPEKQNHVRLTSILLLLNKVLLQFQHHVPHLIIIPYIIRIQDVHSLCVLAEGSSVIGLFEFFGLVAEGA